MPRAGELHGHGELEQGLWFEGAAIVLRTRLLTDVLRGEHAEVERRQELALGKLQVEFELRGLERESAQFRSLVERESHIARDERRRRVARGRERARQQRVGRHLRLASLAAPVEREQDGGLLQVGFGAHEARLALDDQPLVVDQVDRGDLALLDEDPHLLLSAPCKLELPLRDRALAAARHPLPVGLRRLARRLESLAGHDRLGLLLSDARLPQRDASRVDREALQYRHEHAETELAGLVRARAVVVGREVAAPDAVAAADRRAEFLKRLLEREVPALILVVAFHAELALSTEPRVEAAACREHATTGNLELLQRSEHEREVRLDRAEQYVELERRALAHRRGPEHGHGGRWFRTQALGDRRGRRQGQRATRRCRGLTRAGAASQPEKQADAHHFFFSPPLDFDLPPSLSAVSSGALAIDGGKAFNCRHIS